MSPPRQTGERYGVCFPRVSGDEPTSAHYVASGGRFSPRERG